MRIKWLFRGSLIAFFIALSSVPVTLAEAGVLNIGNIPDSIRQHAIAVLRYSTLRFEVSSENRAKLYHHYAVTIFNKDATPFGRLLEVYDPSNQIKKIQVKLYDENGQLIRKVPSKEIQDYSAVNGGTLYSDDRLKLYTPETQNYPYTVEYQIERQIDGLLFYPVWLPQPGYNYGVEKASFIMAVKKGLKPRYKAVNIQEPMIDTLESDVVYTWNVNGLIPLISEPLSIPFQELVPVVYTAPTRFSYEKYSGIMSSWEGIGNWVRTLNQDRQQLAPETVAAIRALVSESDDVIEIVQKVYHYVQHHTRYVSVQLGIGGYQPWPASFVDEQGYGDCKALVNYTQALLKVAGVKSGYTLVRAGINATPILRDFPSMQFNHVILTIPVDNDTIWLECTDQTIPFNFIGSFTGDRTGLMITEEKTQLIHTPVYGKKQNLQIRKGFAQIDEVGNAVAEVHTDYSGLQYEIVHPLLKLGGKEQKKNIVSDVGYSGFSH